MQTTRTQRHASLDELVAKCLSFHEAGDTAAIARVCERHPDQAPALRRRLARLDAAGFLTATGKEDVPRRIGRFRIERSLGRGGMGVVYLGEQVEPVRRRVAVKVIKPGMDTGDVLARFDAERQALALMDHPCIARVYEAGSTEQGRPWFAMEYVPGLPITSYCARHGLDVEERLRLFLRVCDGVQHAHFKGIVHRDLKPSNVLVADVDGERVPKIIDFGIAKAIGVELSSDLQTLQGQLLGTPEYMSPEQAGRDGFDVDTRTDVYSLGVLLYELLTGKLPFESEMLRAAGCGGLREILQERMPQAPSTRIVNADAARGEPPDTKRASALRRRLRGDLDLITLKALAKDRKDRYASPRDLAADVRRHLGGEPVLASPPSRVYLLRKFVQRNRTKVIAAGLTLLSLVAGGAGTLLGLLRAERALDDFGQLATVERLKEAKRAEARLYPAWPERVPALESWLRELGRPLALAYPVLAKRVRGAPREHADPADRFLFRTLRELVRELEGFRAGEGMLAAVEERLAWARTVQARSIDAHREAWRVVCEAVRKSRRFGRFPLTPQVGLVPLGKDPGSGLFEFAHLRSGTVPVRGQDGRLVIEDGSAIVFVLVPGGHTLVGAQKTDPLAPRFSLLAHGDERPVGVRLAPFFVAKHELSQGQWVRLGGGTNPSSYRAGERPGTELFTWRNPVEGIGFDVTSALLARHGLAIPTEAQWEYACRAGTSTPWWTGARHESLRGAVNINDQAAEREGAQWRGAEHWPELDDGFAAHAPVDTLRANGFGLHHVHGNVDEWVRDWFGGPGRELRDGDGLRVGPASNLRLIRGGSYKDSFLATRSAERRRVAASVVSDQIGVRAVRRIRP